MPFFFNIKNGVMDTRSSDAPTAPIDSTFIDILTGNTLWYKFSNGDLSADSRTIYNYSPSVLNYDGYISTDAGSTATTASSTTVTISTAQSKFGNGSLYLANNNTQKYTFCTKQFVMPSNTANTVSWWSYTMYNPNYDIGYLTLQYTNNIGGQNFACYDSRSTSSCTIAYIQYLNANIGMPHNLTGLTNIGFNNWIHYTFVMGSSGTNASAFYINGVLQGNYTDPSAYGDGSRTEIWSLGIFSLYPGSVYGYFNDFRYYNGVALTQTQIQAIYNAGISTASISSYSVVRFNNTFTISWTGTNVSSVTLTNFTKKLNYGKITTNGVAYNDISYTPTDQYYLTPYDSNNVAGIATKIFTIA